MYAIGDNKVVITVTIPTELQQANVGLTKDNISVVARGPTSPGGRLDEVDQDTDVDGATATGQVEIAADNANVEIHLDSINTGGTITLTYDLEHDDTNSGLITLPTTPPGNDPDRSAFTVTTAIPTATAAGTAVNATSVSGGRILPQAGSGTITMSPEKGEAGDDIRKITLTYTTGTPLENVTLEIDVKGIVVEDDTDTEDVTEQLHDDVANDDDYGYVTHSATFTPTQTIGTAAADQRRDYHSVEWADVYQSGSEFRCDH